MMDEQFIADLQKGQEGNILAIAAISEVLTKMDARLQKQDEEDYEESMKDEEDKAANEALLEKQAMEQRITASVVKQLMELNGDQAVSVSGKATWPMSSRSTSEDQEVKVTPRTKTEEMQKPIQAMEKGAYQRGAYQKGAYPGDPNDEEGAEEYPVEMPPMPPEEGVEKDYPMEEDEYENYPEEVRHMFKAFNELKKENAEMKKSLPDLIKSQTDARLKKMGWRTETGLAAPRAIGNPDVPIVKSSGGDDSDLVDQLTKMSWKDLRNLQVDYEAGRSDGIQGLTS